MGGNQTRDLAAQQVDLREAMDAAGYPMPREAAVRIVAELHGRGRVIHERTPPVTETRSDDPGGGL